MPDWSIKIVPAASQIAGAPDQFVPDVPGTKPGDPLKALATDVVTWNNTTNDDHWPWPTDNNYNPLPDAQVPRQSPFYLSDKIPAGQSSRPNWVAVKPPTGNTVYYCCKLHPQMRGTIVIT
jgi:hypothetical protein